MICKNCLSTDIKKLQNKANIYICNDCGKLLLKPKEDKFTVISVDDLNKRMMVQCNYCSCLLEFSSNKNLPTIKYCK